MAPPDVARALQFRRPQPRNRALSALHVAIIMERLEQARTPDIRQERIERLVERLAKCGGAGEQKGSSQMP